MLGSDFGIVRIALYIVDMPLLGQQYWRNILLTPTRRRLILVLGVVVVWFGFRNQALMPSLSIVHQQVVNQHYLGLAHAQYAVLWYLVILVEFVTF